MRTLGLILVAAIIIVSGCNPLGSDGEETAMPGSTPTPTEQPESTLQPMVIVTRTPVDPDQIPATAESTPGNVDVPSTYIVQEGDSLYSIAIKFQLELAEIVALNGLRDPNDITVGQELILPAPDDE